jgi:Na+/melibiose symporter-like transporter
MHHEQQKTEIAEFGEQISLCSLLKDFYNSKMFSVIILTWFWFFVILALVVYSVIKYFQSEQPKDLILYASLFIVAIQFVALMKIFAWQFIHRNSIKRDLKKLEQRIAELSEKIGK